MALLTFILLFGAYLNRKGCAIIDFISEAWFEVVGSGNEKHYIAGTRVGKMRRATAAIRYVVIPAAADIDKALVDMLRSEASAEANAAAARAQQLTRRS